MIQWNILVKHIVANEKDKKVVKVCLVPLLEPSSPRITLIAEITCCTAGGDMEVA